jgi:hypothetical protein
MAIHVTCVCVTRFKARDEFEGRRAFCISCRREFVFQREAPAIDRDSLWSSKSRAASIIVAAILVSAFFWWLARSYLGGRGPDKAVSTPEAVAASALYVITEDNVNQFMKKRIVTARLKNKVLLDELRVIALEIKNADPTQYDYGFINFTIAGWPKDRDYWAQADWSKDSPLSVEIRGLSLSDERFYRTTPLDLPDGARLLGTWLCDAGIGSGRTTIYEKGGKYFYHAQFGGGDKPSGIEMGELPSEDGLSL